jgi:hypothetical protein
MLPSLAMPPVKCAWSGTFRQARLIYGATLSMSQISPSIQSFYGGGVPSGTASYASPTVPSSSIPHEGMSTDKIVLITVGSTAAAALIGAGIYYFVKKDKSSGKGASATSGTTQRGDGSNQVDVSSSHGTRSESASTVRETGNHRNNSIDPQDDDYQLSPEIVAFTNAYKASDIRNSNRLFKKLSPQEKEYFITEELKDVKDSEDLGLAKKIYFVFFDGDLPHKIDQAFILKANSIGFESDNIDFKKEILHLRSLSDKDQLSWLSRWIDRLEIDDSSGPPVQELKDLLELYYEKLFKPEISEATHKAVSKIAAKKLHMNFR